MATVKYTVLYKYIHPLTKNPITNRQSDYSSYGSVIEQVRGSVQPTGFSGTWPKEQTAVNPLMVGEKQTGMMQDASYLDELTGFDPIAQQLGDEIKILSAEINALQQQKTKLEKDKVDSKATLLNLHPSGEINFGSGTTVATFETNATTGTINLYNSASKKCSATVGSYYSSSKYFISWSHDVECTNALNSYNYAVSNLPSINADITSKSATLNTKTIAYNDRIGRVAPQAEKNFIIDRNYPDSKNFDMLYCFDTTRMAYSKEYIFDKTSGNEKNVSLEVYIDTFKQVKGDPWFTASEHGSLQSAMAAASPLIKRLGKDNVKVVKNVPIDITVHIE